MTQTLRDVMTTDLVACPSSASLAEAAQLMRDKDIGTVLVTTDGTLRGIVTDRDLVVRCLAEAADPSTAVGNVFSGELVTAQADDSVESAVELMRSRALRRLPVVDGDQAVGIVSLGDLAREREPQSVLADISAAPANG
ncbi:CBS domain-containing protein [Desertimonas flava]|uniref:CBS domain-containing protein n=1 Tax=Desertimonas flava TaxID=2064846 RepID=UPI000E354E5F|nr:CBS domain-containing protein [Desertimonas flava]